MVARRGSARATDACKGVVMKEFRSERRDQRRGKKGTEKGKVTTTPPQRFRKKAQARCLPRGSSRTAECRGHACEPRSRRRESLSSEREELYLWREEGKI